MTDKTYYNLAQVITDPLFADMDLQLRSSVHIGMDDIRAYEFLLQAQEYLENFYAMYECRLVHGQEGYFYLLSEGDKLGKKQLSRAEMLLGQVLALLSMDPAYLGRSGRIPVNDVLQNLEMLLGQERLAAQLAPRSRGKDSETDNRKIREAVEKALRGLDALGFVKIIEASGQKELLPRRAIMRFAAPVREAGELDAALQNLIATGEVVLGAEEESDNEQNENDDA